MRNQRTSGNTKRSSNGMRHRLRRQISTGVETLEVRLALSAADDTLATSTIASKCVFPLPDPLLDTSDQQEIFAPFPPEDTFKLHRRSSATKVIYLDF